MSGRRGGAALAMLADIGGTNVRFALAELESPAPLLSDTVRQYEVADFPNLHTAGLHYLEQMHAPRPGTGVFAVAGRIDGDLARITNHPWLISCGETAKALGLATLRLVNDFAAQAMAVELLDGDDLVRLGGPGWRHPPAERSTFAVIGPGTGLGVSALIVREGRGIALETEGGHVAFAPHDALEVAVLSRLVARFDRVSNERLISGGGLVNIHRALCEIDGVPVGELRPRDVTAAAASGDARAVRALDVFYAVFGAVTGDLVLTLGAWDGAFLTGGLVPRLLPQLQASEFHARFVTKGRFADAMARVPIMAVVHPQAGLLGAAAFAAQDYALAAGLAHRTVD
ncbi:glucokinase [soil metagenome]